MLSIEINWMEVMTQSKKKGNEMINLNEKYKGYGPKKSKSSPTSSDISDKDTISWEATS